MKQSLTENTKLLAFSHKLLNQFLREPQSTPESRHAVLSALVAELRHCKYLIRKSSSLSQDSRLMLSAQITVYTKNLDAIASKTGQLLAEDQRTMDVVASFCGLVRGSTVAMETRTMASCTKRIHDPAPQVKVPCHGHQ